MMVVMMVISYNECLTLLIMIISASMIYSKGNEALHYQPEIAWVINYKPFAHYQPVINQQFIQQFIQPEWCHHQAQLSIRMLSCATVATLHTVPVSQWLTEVEKDTRIYLDSQDSLVNLIQQINLNG